MLSVASPDAARADDAAQTAAPVLVVQQGAKGPVLRPLVAPGRVAPPGWELACLREADWRMGRCALHFVRGDEQLRFDLIPLGASSLDAAMARLSGIHASDRRKACTLRDERRGTWGDRPAALQRVLCSGRARRPVREVTLLWAQLGPGHALLLRHVGARGAGTSKATPADVVELANRIELFGGRGLVLR